MKGNENALNFNNLAKNTKVDIIVWDKSLLQSSER